MNKYVERPLEVEAEQFFYDKKPWPKGVKHLESWMYQDMFMGFGNWEGVVAFMYEEPSPVVNYLRDGDWVVRHTYDGRVHSMSDYKFRMRYQPAGIAIGKMFT